MRAISTSSLAKSTSEFDDSSSTSSSGCCSMKLPMRGVSQRAAKDGMVLMVRRLSRLPACNTRVASAICNSASRTRSA
jgi:hypothetical protein